VGGNPLKYADPKGLFFWDVIDIGFFVKSVYDFFQCSSSDNAINLGLDAIGLLPLVPALGAIRRVEDAAKKILALPSLQVPNAGGEIISRVTENDEIYSRVFSSNNTGAYLTKVAPTSKQGAIEALALPPGNNADYIQQVVVPAGTRLQRSRALPAFGRRGGKEQFQLIDRIPDSAFGPGRPLQ
jgi:hypothetical protein